MEKVRLKNWILYWHVYIVFTVHFEPHLPINPDRSAKITEETDGKSG